MDPLAADPPAKRGSDGVEPTRQSRHRFRSRVRAFWRRVQGVHEEHEGLLNGLALTEAPSALPVRVVQVLGGCQRMRRLLEIGIYPGASLEVISTGRRGPIIVKLGETRLAVGRNVARAVLVDIAPST